MLKIKMDETQTKDRNEAEIIGNIEGKFEHSHFSYGAEFFKAIVTVTRESKEQDHILVIASRQVLQEIKKDLGQKTCIKVKGQFQSRNVIGKDGKSHLQLFLFAKEVKIYENDTKDSKQNYVLLEGTICKEPILRRTPLSKRKITELTLAINREYRRSSYIPCIAWESEAELAETLKVGDRICLHGRIQSREYFKRSSPESQEGEYRTVYEVSITRIDEIVLKVDF